MGTYYRAALIKSLGLARSEGRILDVGGYDGFLLSRIVAPQKFSVDIETIAFHPNINYCRGDGLRLPFRDESFETVYALDVLEHVDDEATLSSELIRVLKPGGRLLLTTPHEDIRIFPGVIQPWVNKRWQHYRTAGYSVGAVESLFAGTDLVECKIRMLSIPGFRLSYVPLSVIWRLWPSLGIQVIEKVARFDAGRGEGRGYVLAEVRKVDSCLA